jgi:hypothetical protein
MLRSEIRTAISAADKQLHGESQVGANASMESGEQYRADSSQPAAASKLL